MKLFFGFAIFLWLLCGVAGAWRLDGVHDMHLKDIAKGPIILIHAMNEYPIEYPGPN